MLGSLEIRKRRKAIVLRIMGTGGGRMEWRSRRVELNAEEDVVEVVVRVYMVSLDLQKNEKGV